ncbi:MAG: hypothetical protein ICV87_13515, partial [Gemmatimonadetes bacterium]|nr:hypothetical protein [Gemmatimonadota bacterium]
LVCRREVEAMRAQTAALASLADPEPRPGAWRALEAALAAEGLVQPERTRRYTASHPLLRIAAGLLLFALGAGAAVAILRPGSPQQVAQTPAPSAGTGRVLGIAQLPPAHADSTPVADRAVPEAAPVAAHLVSSAGGAVRGETPRRRPPPLTARARAAARELDEAEKAYVAALRHYAEIADPASGADPETRLAALETLVETTGRALERAPGDPVLNGYHLAVLDERDALRRQIDRASESAWY